MLKSDVDWTLLPPRLNPRLVELLRRCLEKNLRSAPTPATPAWKRALVVAAAAMVGAALAGVAVWTLRPDAPRIVYLANNRIYVREMNSLEARVIFSSEGQGTAPISPTFSPDGQSIAFALGGGLNWLLKRIAVSGGAATTMSDLESPTHGMRWDEHGILIGLGSKGIGRVSDVGGAPEIILRGKADELLASPQLLADGKTILYTVKPLTLVWDKASIVVQRLDGGERKVLIAGGSDGRYLPTGHLVYMLNGVWLGVPFNETELSLSRGSTPVVEGVRRRLLSRPTARWSTCPDRWEPRSSETICRSSIEKGQ